jgi:hypothetical protein
VISPYLAPGFYEKALAAGRHRDIVGGRWDETGRIQMQILQEAGMEPHHRLVDIGAGSLRLGCKAVPFLHPGHYWASDASLALMQRGRAAELPDPGRLPENHLIGDAAFALPGLPPDIDFAIAFGVFTHLPEPVVAAALASLRPRLGAVRAFLFTVFLRPSESSGAFRQADGVVTHDTRPPYHQPEARLLALTAAAGWKAQRHKVLLPRGQALFIALPDPAAPGANQTATSDHNSPQTP